ncbi:MAG: heavy-metal-associated domain-containing protein [Hyphomicrobiaceae bacterium]|nr:MAG: heavy-metal-associated domain-containing protein [Hyphomicrobiaceae bacterium]
MKNMKREQAGNAVAELDLAVPSMVCDGCAEAIRTALAKLPGVRDVKVSPWRRRVRLRYEAARIQQGEIRQAISNAGFAVAER